MGAFFSLVADAPLITMTPAGVVTRGTYGRGDGAREYNRQLAVLRQLITTTPAFLATRTADLLRAQREHKVAAFLACEGGEFLDGQPERVDQLHADGVRSLQLVHYVPNILGDLQTQPRHHGGLSTIGKAVVKRATKAGIVLDVAHAAFDTVRDVVGRNGLGVGSKEANHHWFASLPYARLKWHVQFHDNPRSATTTHYGAAITFVLSSRIG